MIRDRIKDTSRAIKQQYGIINNQKTTIATGKRLQLCLAVDFNGH